MPMTVQRRLAAPRALITKSTATTASITPAANVIARAMAVWKRDVAPSHGLNQQSGCRHGSPTGCSRAAKQGVPSAPLGEFAPIRRHRYDHAGIDRCRLLQHGLNMTCHERFLTACYHRDPALPIWSLTSPVDDSRLLQQSVAKRRDRPAQSNLWSLLSSGIRVKPLVL